MIHKVAFVVQRYGLEVNGGAELQCRWIAELMRHSWDVEVITTCALDYMSWANYYPEGEDEINGVRVRRFPVVTKRDIRAFNGLCEKVFRQPHTRDDEIAWMRAQGPNAPKLTDYIAANRDSYDAFIFDTYLYETTFWALPLVADKAFLVPNAHDEPPVYLSIYDELFRQPKGFIFNTEEEKNFLVKRFDLDCTFSDVVGVGIKFDPSFLNYVSPGLKLPPNFLLYVGRIDESKGCKELFEFWEMYKKRQPNELKLALIGRSQMEIPRRHDIVELGFVSEEDKFFAMSKAKCLIAPSLFESLCMVIMESWLCGRPVLVNGRCNVLTGQCRRSNGGLWYRDYDEFEACLDLLISDEGKGKRMACCGKNYVQKNYDWGIIKKKYKQIVEGAMKPQ
ncbi:MAG: glycosyltransferase family 4 protein [Deltaproteobacteria bacterium]|nr:glycosyltransferase family 4 protein [Deltaproteobacteria bacterium]